MRRIPLDGSHIRALAADRLKTASSLFLRGGFTAKGEVRLLGADIGGNLECGGGTFENPGGNALIAHRLKTAGGVFLRGRFTARGEVRLLGAEIGGVAGRGDEYRELFAGFNWFFYGHKLKWQTGLQFTEMDDSDLGDGEYDGWGFTTGLRISW